MTPTASTPPSPNVRRCPLPRPILTHPKMAPPSETSPSAAPQVVLVPLPAPPSHTISRDPVIVTTTIPPDEAPAITRLVVIKPASGYAAAQQSVRPMREMQIDRFTFDVPATLSDQDLYWVRDMALSSWQEFLYGIDRASKERLRAFLEHNRKKD